MHGNLFNYMTAHNDQPMGNVFELSHYRAQRLPQPAPAESQHVGEDDSVLEILAYACFVADLLESGLDEDEPLGYIAPFAEPPQPPNPAPAETPLQAEQRILQEKAMWRARLLGGQALPMQDLPKDAAGIKAFVVSLFEKNQPTNLQK